MLNTPDKTVPPTKIRDLEAVKFLVVAKNLEPNFLHT